MLYRNTDPRRGGVTPLVALCLVGLMGFIALAVDLSIVVLVRNQAQNAADVAALAGTRTLTGDPNYQIPNPNNPNQTVTDPYHVSAALPNAQTALQNNKILGQACGSGTDVVSIQVGQYYYSRASNTFVAWPADPGSTKSPGTSANWPSVVANTDVPPTLTTVTYTTQSPLYFGRVFGMSSMSVSAQATAVHRPRDVALVIDFSGSMRLDSQLSGPLVYSWTDSGGTTYYGASARTTSRSQDTLYPQFGPYGNLNGTSGGTASDGGPSVGFAILGDPTVSLQNVTGEYIGMANLTSQKADPTGNVEDKPMVKDFFGDATAYGTTTPAFTPSAVATVTVPGGDAYKTNPGGNGATTSGYVARNVNDVLGRYVWNYMDSNGYSFDGTGNGASNTFSGSTNPPNNLSTWKADSNGYLWNGSHVWMGQTATNPNGPNTYTSDPSTPNKATYWTTRTVSGDTNFETNGYGASFKGYTEGPGYWGKTFFMWPPDPRGPSTANDTSATNDAKDWRQRFFVLTIQPTTAPSVHVPPVPAVPSPPPTSPPPTSPPPSGPPPSSPPPSSPPPSSPPPPPPPHRPRRRPRVARRPWPTPSRG